MTSTVAIWRFVSSYDDRSPDAPVPQGRRAAVFHLAGGDSQVNSENFLIPVDFLRQSAAES